MTLNDAVKLIEMTMAGDTDPIRLMMYLTQVVENVELFTSGTCNDPKDIWNAVLALVA